MLYDDCKYEDRFKLLGLDEDFKLTASAAGQQSDLFQIDGTSSAGGVQSADGNSVKVDDSLDQAITI